MLGLHHNNSYYIDLSLPFEFRLGSFFFQKLSDAVHYIMTKNGHDALLNYIDDLIYCGLPSSIQDLGLDISAKKLQPPDTKMGCLGILFDTVNRTISIPDEKLAEVIHMCQIWAEKLACNKRELQSLQGSLLYVSKCVKPARIFLNCML